MKILKGLAADLKTQTIVDLTANAGGDLIGLSHVFGKVVGVEIDPINFTCLVYNVSQILKLSNVTLYNEDSSVSYKKICNSHKANYVFLDPLWGPDYKSKEVVNLELIGKPGQFDALIRHMITKNKTLIVKAPLNYNRE
jgi:16S rRNA G966 N2-methylase RsmD